MNYNHLKQSAQKYLNLDIDSRIAVIQREVWVDYGTSEAVFHMMNNMADVPDRQNAPALLVTGPGGAGKSAIIAKIRNRVRRSEGLIFLSMAESPEIAIKKSLRTELAIAVGIPIDQHSRVRPGSEIPREIAEVIKLRGFWGVVIDELHDALLRPKHEQRINMSILKKLLSSEYGLKLFCFGTIAAKQALQSNDEFKRRFFEVPLKDWIEDEAFRAFLLEIEESLPLKKPSNLYSKEMVKEILHTTSGRMDSTISLIRSAACYALRSGAECIDVDFLQRAKRNPWGY